MELHLEAVVVAIDGAGHIKERVSDVSGFALRLDGIEIDGVSFGFSDSGDVMLVTMNGENLSDDITTNYPARPHSPIMQIGFRDPAARLTANTLNKLMRRMNKIFPGHSLLIRDAGKAD